MKKSNAVLQLVIESRMLTYFFYFRRQKLLIEDEISVCTVYIYEKKGKYQTERKKKESSNNMTESMQRLCKGFSLYGSEYWDFPSE